MTIWKGILLTASIALAAYVISRRRRSSLIDTMIEWIRDHASTPDERVLAIAIASVKIFNADGDDTMLGRIPLSARMLIRHIMRMIYRGKSDDEIFAYFDAHAKVHITIGGPRKNGGVELKVEEDEES